MKNISTKAKEIITADIRALSHDGRGIANPHGKTIFVSGALAHEKVKCRITKKCSRYNEAEIVEVITPAAERTEPACQHFSICGGCSMQHMTISAQLALKQKTLLEQLAHFGRVTPEIVLPPLTGQQTLGYRRKARLGVYYIRQKKELRVGFREKSGQFLADLSHCPVLHASVGTKISALKELIINLSQYDRISQIDVAVGDTQTALVFRNLSTLPEEDLMQLIEFSKHHDLQIYLQPNAPAPIQKIWPQDQHDRLTYTLPEYQLTMDFHPLDFTQVNHEINQLMLKQTLELLDPQPTEHILDLFCGLGNFTLPIARFAKHVTGIEGNEEMVRRAQENAQKNQIQNTDFYAANLMAPVAQTAWMQKQYDKILLDPPRAGAKEMLDFFSGFSAKKIVYVSCNPATLARDAGELVHKHHYKLKRVGIINMFPHTAHIEAIAVFEK